MPTDDSPNLYDQHIQRFVDVSGRLNALRRIARQERKSLRVGNPLAEIGFRPPLSVAGFDSPIIVRAEGLRLEGIPIGLELDECGQHRGTPLDAVLAKLRRKYRVTFDPAEVLANYRAFMLAGEFALTDHKDARFNRVPDLMKRLRTEQRKLEDILRNLFEVHDTRVFCVAVARHALWASLDRVDATGVVESVVVGFSGGGASVRIAGSPVRTLWGVGCGLVTVRTDDLRSLTSSTATDGESVTLDFDLDGWDGQVEAVEQTASPDQRFAYFTKDE